ncbi:MAG: hypothetical protein FWG11_03990, partial [Promicromonosporaceae bacterium]|nr:hypothetical protein [Promicromonosporaceae bacterium]
APACLACVAGGSLAAGLAGLVIVWRSGPATYSLTALWHALKLGLPTVPHSAALTGVVAGLVVIAERRLDAAATAQVILTLGAGATMLIGAVNNAWAPLIFSTVKERRLAVLDETSRAITYLMAAVVVAVALGSSVLVHLAAPATFDRAQMIPAVAIAALAAIPSVPYFASSHLLLVHAQTGWLALTTPTAFAGAMALGWWLTGQWGIVGIGVAYAAAWLLLGVLTTLAQRTAGEDKWWPKPHLLALAAVAVAAVAGAWLPTDLPGVALRAALAAALALPLLWRTYRLVRGKR